jgi:hypothetical protein
MVGAHHHTIGNTFLPDASLRDVLTTFEDPQVRARLASEAGTIDQPAMERLLKRLLIVGISDVAGGPEAGNLSATGVITYRSNYELLSKFAQEAASYDDFLAKIGAAAAEPQETRRRFAMAPARCDRQMDANGGLDFYWPMIEGKAKELIAGREITAEEWQQALEFAPRMRRVEYYTSFQFSVADPATGALPEGLTGGSTETEHIRINPNYIKYRILMGKIAQAVEQAHGKDSNVLFNAKRRDHDDSPVSRWLNQLLNTTPVSEISVSCDAAGLKITKAGGETVAAGTIEQEPRSVLITINI